MASHNYFLPGFVCDTAKHTKLRLVPGAKAFSSAVFTVQVSPVKGCRQAQMKPAGPVMHVPPFWHGKLLQLERSCAPGRESQQKKRIIHLQQELFSRIVEMLNLK